MPLCVLNLAVAARGEQRHRELEAFVRARAGQPSTSAGLLTISSCSASSSSKYLAASKQLSESLRFFVPSRMESSSNVSW
jgi:hypothetical protein